MATTLGALGMRCPNCGRAEALDVEALVWVRLTLYGTDPSLCQGDSHQWDETNAARCGVCCWEGTIRELQEVQPREGGDDALSNASSMPRFSCPAGHVEGLRESHQLHVWYPVDAVTGEADYTVDLSDLGPSDVDEEVVSDCYFYCPTCNDSFPELVEISAASGKQSMG